MVMKVVFESPELGPDEDGADANLATATVERAGCQITLHLIAMADDEAHAVLLERALLHMLDAWRALDDVWSGLLQ